MRYWFIVTIMIISIGINFLTSIAKSEANNISMPLNYKSWHYVKTMVINEGHPLFDPFGGIHHIYANETAVKGYKSNKFLSGSVLVFDLYASIDKGNAIIDGNRKFIGVMKKVDNAPKTDGWIYEVFAGEALEPKGVNYAKACHECHSNVKSRDYVFSLMKE